MGFFENLLTYRMEIIKFQVAFMLISFAGTILIVSTHHFLRYWIPYEFYKHDPKFMRTLYRIDARQDKTTDWRWAVYGLCLIIIMLGVIIGCLLSLGESIEYLEYFVRYG